MVLCNAWTARDVEWIINYCLPLPLDLPLDIPLPLDLPLDIPLPLDLPPLEFDLDFPFPLYFLRFFNDLRFILL